MSEKSDQENREAKLIEAAQDLVEKRMKLGLATSESVVALARLGNPPPEIDPNHEYVHKVGAAQLIAFRRGERDFIVSSCGKTWAPTQFDSANKKRCPDCFPIVPNRFAIAS